MTETYRIVRFFLNSHRRFTIKRGLPLSLAQEHCANPETSSRTARKSAGRRRTRRSGEWFDGFYKEKN